MDLPEKEPYDTDFSFKSRLEFYFEGSVLDVPPREVRQSFSNMLSIVGKPVLPFPALLREPEGTDDNDNEINEVEVEVEVLSFEGLSAIIRKIKKGESDLDDKASVPVSYVYPLKTGDTKLKRMPIAEAIEHIRFFYQHLWMPEDENDDTDETFSLKYVTERIKTAYGMDMEQPPDETMDHIIELLGNLPRHKPRFPEVKRIQTVVDLKWWFIILVPLVFLVYVSFCDVYNLENNDVNINLVLFSRYLVNYMSLGFFSQTLNGMYLHEFQTKVLLWLITMPAILAHVGEGLFALVISLQVGDLPVMWFWLQTSILGFPSMRLLLKAKRLRSAKKDE